MPRREFLSPAERETLLVIPAEESEQVRHYTVGRTDLGFIRQHRWAHNRLGVAIQVCYLRCPGRVLNCRETPPSPVAGMLAAQLKMPAVFWAQ